MALPDQVVAGIRLFNSGLYFEAHEVWEEHWGLGSPAERKLLLGLIKAAVALHHLKGGNLRGFDAQLDMGLPHLHATVTHWPELRVDALVEELESLQAAIRFHKDLPAILAQVPMPRLPEP